MQATQRHVSGLGLTMLAALGLAAAPVVHAQTPIAGTYTGTDGAALSGPSAANGNQNAVFGKGGQAGLYLNTNSYSVAAATITGGVGGTTTGTTGATIVVGGPGGYGLSAQNNANVTVLSGTFSGGNGGATNGTATTYLNGGNGSDGYFVDNSTSVVYGGTFTGGNGAGATGSAPTLYGGGGGAGININYQAGVTIDGGSFTGGNAASVTNSGGNAGDGLPAGGVLVESGTASIYGGSFTAGTYAPASPHGSRTATYGYGLDVFSGAATLYGSGFTVNGVSNFSGAVPVGTGTITGKLLDNAAVSTFTYDFLQGATFNIVAVPAPEPSQWAAFGVGALGLGALALCARRRQAV